MGPLKTIEIDNGKREGLEDQKSDAELNRLAMHALDHRSISWEHVHNSLSPVF